MDWVNPGYRSNSQFDGINPSLHEPISTDGIPAYGKRYVVPARQGRAVLVRAGEQLELINPHGSQVCDLWAFCADGMHEHLSMEHVRAHLDRTIPRVADALVTNRRRAILTLLEDSSPGIHDTLIAACDLPRYRSLGVSGYHDNCSDNLRMALAAIGRHASEVPAPFNVWMNNPVGVDGGISWLPPVSRPGDHVTLRAEMDAIVVMSACPQDLVPVNGEDCVPRELIFVVHAVQRPGEAS
ncbi:aminomethyltransferase [Hydrogenophaga sp. Root209]|uniref:DUF1989 domain-containing protein n=1 Tax=Hydrogenophaga sp. Root209 TaxID=1736490 RepID=UPI0006FA2F6F|nr:urea carboxylase-associated family protein [Hydrogenophaga sp. Root209]KRC12122.1 aminomethyltransferase [Hydrogenophaga sp. Root209]